MCLFIIFCCSLLSTINHPCHPRSGELNNEWIIKMFICFSFIIIIIRRLVCDSVVFFRKWCTSYYLFKVLLLSHLFVLMNSWFIESNTNNLNLNQFLFFIIFFRFFYEWKIYIYLYKKSAIKQKLNINWFKFFMTVNGWWLWVVGEFKNNNDDVLI